jgi:hypothetical protein
MVTSMNVAKRVAMKNKFAALFVFALVGSSSLARAACPACDANMKMTKEFQALNYKIEADRSKGGLLAIEAAKSLESFSKLSKKDANRAKTFSSILPLAREAAAYDGEAQMAELLAGAIKDDAKLKRAYDNYLKALPKKSPSNKVDSCKTEQLKASVDEITCRTSAGVKGQDPADAKQAASAQKCVKPFNFEDCIK